MFPIILSSEFTNIILIGDGELADKRLAGLQEAGMTVKRVKDKPPSKRDLKSAHIVYIVDFPEKEAIKIADYCRKNNILVNIEDVIPYCDFHTPSIVRRGDLLFSISTNGKSPGLGIEIKKHISNKFGPEWAERLEIIAKKRQKWRSDGLAGQKLLQKTIDKIKKEGWLP